MASDRPKPHGRDALRILVVEDTAIVGEETKRLLDEFGCTIVGPPSTLDQAIEAVAMRTSMVRCWT